MRWTFWRKERPRRKDAAPSPSDERVERADPTAALRARARRRLIGAAALLLAVVVVVPLLLDSAPRPISDNIPIESPSDRPPFIASNRCLSDAIPFNTERRISMARLTFPIRSWRVVVAGGAAWHAAPTADLAHDVDYHFLMALIEADQRLVEDQ